MQYTALPTTTTATIASGQSLSGSINLGLRSLLGITMPAAWTAAALSFAVSHDGVTFYPVSDQDGEVVIPADVAVAGAAVAIDPALLAGWRFIKVRSGTAGAAVAQGASRTLLLNVREIA